jgi:Cu/Zn superoxide dismutase
MRLNRLAIAFAAMACAVALPAAAAAHKGKPSDHGHKGKDRNGALVRLSPTAGQTAKGAASFTQHTGALSVELIVSRLTPNTFFQAHIHAGACATAPAGAIALTLPDIYADEHGVAKLVTTLPNTTDYLSGGFYIDVHSGATVISCGDITAKTPKAASEARLRGANHEHGRVELFQKGSDISGWIKVKGLTPGAHAVQIHAGTCAAPTGAAATLGDVTADADGNAFAKLTGTSAALAVGTNFTVDVSVGPSATPGAVVVCGDQYPSGWNHGGHGHFSK